MANLRALSRANVRKSGSQEWRRRRANLLDQLLPVSSCQLRSTSAPPGALRSRAVLIEELLLGKIRNVLHPDVIMAAAPCEPTCRATNRTREDVEALARSFPEWDVLLGTRNFLEALGIDGAALAAARLPHLFSVETSQKSADVQSELLERLLHVLPLPVDHLHLPRVEASPFSWLRVGHAPLHVPLLELLVPKQ